MQTSIRHRISNADHDFIQATAQGLPALTTFYHSWSTLQREINHATQTNAIDNEISTLWRTMTSRIAIFSDHLLNLQTNIKSLTSTYQDELEEIFSRVDINATPTDVRASSPFSAESKKSVKPNPNSTSESFPTYIEPAYAWLLENLHNPYPPKETRDSIALTTNTDRKTVDAWFIDARKRIGWNTLRKQHFSNKRADIVETATRFFLQDDESSLENTNIELELTAIEKRAKDLYSHKFSESALAIKLDVAVKDLTPETKAQAKEEEIRRRQQEKETRDRLERNALAASSYPSPNPSPALTPDSVLSSPLLEEVDLVTTYTKSIAGRKRRSFDSDEEDSVPKRPRFDNSPVADTTLSTGLPSPAPSPEPFHTVDERISTSLTPTSNSLPLQHTSNRKRRLSDADSQGIPKRPRNLHIGPRLQAVSDPLPVSNTLFEGSQLDDWLHTHFGIPNSVHSDELDTSLPLDVEVFDYSTLNFTTQPALSKLPVNLPETHSPLALDDIPSLVGDELPPSEKVLDICTNDFNYDELFWDFEQPTPGFSGQNLINQPEDVSLLMSQTPLNNLSHTLNAGIMMDNPELFLQHPVNDIDWFLPPATLSHDVMNPVDKFQDFGQNILPQDSSTMFNSPMGIDFVDPSIEQLLLHADKAAKQKKLQHIKEIARRLEEDIAAS